MFGSEFLLITIAEWAVGPIFSCYSLQPQVSVWSSRNRITRSLYNIGCLCLGGRDFSNFWRKLWIILPAPTSQTLKISTRPRPQSSLKSQYMHSLREQGCTRGLGSVMLLGAACRHQGACHKCGTTVHLRTKGRDEVNNSRNSRQP